MKNQLWIFTIIMLIPLVGNSQEFEATPNRTTIPYIATIEGDDGNKIELNCDAPTQLNMYDYNGHPFIQMYHNSRTPVLELYRDNASYKMEIRHDFLALQGQVGSNLQNWYTLDPNGFTAYDNNQNVSVQIQRSVSGDGRVTTDELEITGGSDLSENFNVADFGEKAEPGMLVSISTNEGDLEITQIKQDKKAVGIISGANGIETGMMMGQKGSIADGDYPIALTGRTYVLANTENGTIEPGDFITSSSIPGYGMKVKNVKKAQGAIIGKAMTSLNEGSGYVLVLVNLQ